MKESLFKKSTDLLKESSEEGLETYDSLLTPLEVDVNIYRCLFCKHEVETRAGLEKCPYCGVSHVFLVPPSVFFNYEIPSLTDVENEDISMTLQLEVSNYLYYREAEEKTDSVEWETYFRYMRRHEGYHKDETAKILGVDDPDESILNDVDLLELPDSEIDIFRKSIKIEKEAIDFYKQALDRAENETLKSIYKGLIGAEEYHIDLISSVINILKHR